MRPHAWWRNQCEYAVKLILLNIMLRQSFSSKNVNFRTQHLVARGTTENSRPGALIHHERYMYVIFEGSCFFCRVDMVFFQGPSTAIPLSHSKTEWLFHKYDSRTGAHQSDTYPSHSLKLFQSSQPRSYKTLLFWRKFAQIICRFKNSKNICIPQERYCESVFLLTVFLNSIMLFDSSLK